MNSNVDMEWEAAKRKALGYDKVDHLTGVIRDGLESMARQVLERNIREGQPSDITITLNVGKANGWSDQEGKVVINLSNYSSAHAASAIQLVNRLPAEQE